MILTKHKYEDDIGIAVLSSICLEKIKKDANNFFCSTCFFIFVLFLIFFWSNCQIRVEIKQEQKANGGGYFGKRLPRDDLRAWRLITRFSERSDLILIIEYLLSLRQTAWSDAVVGVREMSLSNQAYLCQNEVMRREQSLGLRLCHGVACVSKRRFGPGRTLS